MSIPSFFMPSVSKYKKKKKNLYNSFDMIVKNENKFCLQCETVIKSKKKINF